MKVSAAEYFFLAPEDMKILMFVGVGVVILPMSPLLSNVLGTSMECACAHCLLFLTHNLFSNGAMDCSGVHVQ